jgi:hypothetical protein
MDHSTRVVHPRGSEPEPLGVSLDADRRPSESLGRHQRRAKAAEGVEHEIASDREALDYEPRQFLWEAEEARSLEGDGVKGPIDREPSPPSHRGHLGIGESLCHGNIMPELKTSRDVVAFGTKRFLAPGSPSKTPISFRRVAVRLQFERVTDDEPNHDRAFQMESRDIFPFTGVLAMLEGDLRRGLA